MLLVPAPWLPLSALIFELLNQPPQFGRGLHQLLCRFLRIADLRQSFFFFSANATWPNLLDATAHIR